MKKIILAMPKSASTSLMRGVSEITGLQGVQEFSFTPSRLHQRLRRKSRALLASLPINPFAAQASEWKLRRRFPARDYPHLSQMHSDLCGFTVDAHPHLLRMAKSDCFYKQHFPPTIVNKALLADWEKILLVRDSSEIIESYSRTVALNDEKAILAKLLQSRSFREALLKELEMWRDGWSECEGVSVITYRELIANSGRAMEFVLATFGIDCDVPAEFTLPKERYTRN